MQFLLVVTGIIVILVIFVWIIICHTSDGYDRMSFRETMDLCELPIVTFTNNSKKFNFLLDTGASKSIINKTVLEELEYERLNKETSLYGSEGNRQTVPFIKMSVGYRDRYYEEEFQVVDMSSAFGNLKSDYGVNLHGILSSTFFQKYKYILDFDALIAYSMK